MFRADDSSSSGSLLTTILCIVTAISMRFPKITGYRLDDAAADDEADEDGRLEDVGVA